MGIFLSLSPLPRLGLAFEGLPLSSVLGGGVPWWRTCCALPCNPSRIILLRLFYFILLPNRAAAVLRPAQLMTAPKAGEQQGHRESSLALSSRGASSEAMCPWGQPHMSLGTAPVWLCWLQRGHFDAYTKPRDFSSGPNSCFSFFFFKSVGNVCRNFLDFRGVAGKESI